MNTLYIYNVDTKEIVQTIIGANNKECEKLASEANWDEDIYGWSYTDYGLKK
jgi:hypothetical protein